ncbi:MAG: nitrilase [Zetaproteobacteria bacterium CG12_big_fil_rev_8_21_14_0_65_54_13]|nr:MAG: nitrilase [Zetaproteobacteria bacterium CG23_combo_of_CG06-09_8_20_14_all_54_7]PIW47730.1 MAG: nitrilase [Zetaproteobacteria bacterium CG12_big_fil_rev_8_21_14_0_65_54_13]PIX53477.1 MAG: nitrilase [Zetaproteobacteria bacterium CG_4_10_14_3_um_filter_54_28]PJA30974.1 MAG: nitrilase [Zetaproteobacteria bacterium CG_4_9_14_3_um_filter_54_145]
MGTVAIVQKAPALLDKTASITCAIDAVKQAASEGATLVVFTETFIPGYPAWIWRLRPGADWSLCEDLHALLLANAVNLASDDLMPLCHAAREYNTTIVCGINEIDHATSRATLYNTVIIIGPDGKIINRHRKLMPTSPERMVWGFGDASGLKVAETPAGRIGTLICWENYMPLARYALYAQGVEIYIAPTYDSGTDWLETLRHIAREGRCWVFGCGNIMQASDIPEHFPQKATLYPAPDEWVNAGDSVLIEPGGKIVAGPLHQQQGILFHDIDLNLALTAKRALDVAGHYARPDIFTLHVNAKPQSPFAFTQYHQ